jgi:tungstate transport system substrate-binding protein
MGHTLTVDANGRLTQCQTGAHQSPAEKPSAPFLRESDPSLRNCHVAIETKSARIPKAKAAGARDFADFMVSKAVQARSKEFGIAA